jgi:hypothetical protein
VGYPAPHRVGAGPASWFTGDLPRTSVAHILAIYGTPGFFLSSDTQNIIELLGPREVIGQAIELLMAGDRVSRDTAFAMLVSSSSQCQLSVREIAAQIVRQRSA